MERVAELSNKKSREKSLAVKKTDQGEQKGKSNRIEQRKWQTG